MLIDIKLDFDYKLEAEADTMLERYKEAISAQPPQYENMADNIQPIFSIRLCSYRGGALGLVFVHAPVYSDVEAAYFDELQQCLFLQWKTLLKNFLFMLI